MISVSLFFLSVSYSAGIPGIEYAPDTTSQLSKRKSAAQLPSGCARRTESSLKSPTPLEATSCGSVSSEYVRSSPASSGFPEKPTSLLTIRSDKSSAPILLP